MKPNTDGSPITPPAALWRVRRIISRASSVITVGSVSHGVGRSRRGCSASTSESRSAETVGRVRRAGDQRHLAGRLAGPDHAQELGLVALFAAEGAQPPGAQQVELVGLLAGLVERRAARQREPGRAAVRRPRGRTGG